ncbi:lytic transglycosylase domain-containing protein [Pseudaestuariivita atlantica]|uniref:Lytic murein transglycosylase n=1 Tax=Pseudaestuariivita atlantica TaxID=1317121 RepID=A0A0L1JSS1_9RHOB|nr:lytic transglycosylase domain-containing protein [Pseudaestuariivita atlantica]KNG94811.1 lytic murein transglycosylase [Pseudaestuariivita atlantica]
MTPRSILAALCALFIAATPGLAEAPEPFPDFKAKRVKPPKPGAARRITVQIEPRVAPAAPAPSAGAAPATGALNWYWQAVSPKLSDSGPGRLETALRALSKGPGGAQVPAPRLQVMQDIAEAHGIELLKSSIGTRVSPAFALAVIAVESSGRADAQSGAGAQGLMQLMPATAERFGVDDSFNPAQNIKGGVAFLDLLMEKFDGDPVLVLAGYNAGENAVTKHDGVPPFAETRDYVPKVLAAFQVARGLCLTPPELVTDGCVFRVASR